MGASSSKAVRQTAQTATKTPPTWAAATTQSTEAAARARPSTVGRASAIKDDFIKQDAQDPHLLSQLNRIGPVTVNPQNMPFQTAQSARIAKIFQTRQATEEASEVPQRNRLPVQAVTDMLNERKSAKTQADLANLAKDYSVDVEVLNRLAERFNSPTVAPARGRQTTDANDSGIPRLLAYWTSAYVDAPKKR